jgi:hypothetical protein
MTTFQLPTIYSPFSMNVSDTRLAGLLNPNRDGKLVIYFGVTPDNAYDIINYEYSLNENDYIALNPPITQSPITILNLTNGLEYRIKLRLVVRLKSNQNILKGLSSQIFTAIPYSTPSRPTQLLVNSLQGSIYVSFNVPYNGGSPITKYQYSLSTDNGLTFNGFTDYIPDQLTNSTTSPVTTLTPTTETIIIGGLINGRSYRVKLRAVNNAGYGIESLPSLQSTPFSVPLKPNILSYVAGNQSVIITLDIPNDSGSPITNYKRSISGLIFTSLNPPQNSRTITIPLTNNGTAYSIRLKAVNRAGDSESSNPIDVIPFGPPTAPLNISVTASNTSAIINFSPPLNSNGFPISNYQVSTKQNDGTFGTYVSCNPPQITSPITVINLTNGISYQFKIRAVNQNATGLESNASSTVIPFFSVNTTQPRQVVEQCNYRGTLKQDGTCECLLNWKGSSCQYSDNITCNGNGTVRNDGICDCRRDSNGTILFRGPNCQYSDYLSCSNNGQVINDQGQCLCRTDHNGHAFKGPNCQYSRTLTCSGIVDPDFNGTCNCNATLAPLLQPRTGSKCQFCTSNNKAGPNCEFSNEDTCNGKGIVDFYGKCSCNDGHNGPRCQYSDSVTCNNRGKAKNDGSCDCNPNTGWKGNNCEICQSEPVKIYQKNPDGTDQLDQNQQRILKYEISWKGNNCNYSDRITCNGNGIVNGLTGVCTCNYGWKGDSCNINPLSSCKGRATSVDNEGVCNCVRKIPTEKNPNPEPIYAGKFCEKCNTGYDGSKCQFNNIDNCNGKGIVKGTIVPIPDPMSTVRPDGTRPTIFGEHPVCSCQPGYNGKECQYSIEKDCNNRASFVNNNGNCSCIQGYSGSKCQFSKIINCNDRGEITYTTISPSPSYNPFNEIPICSCAPPFSGSKCQFCNDTKGYIIKELNVANKCSCVLGFSDIVCTTDERTSYLDGIVNISDVNKVPGTELTELRYVSTGRATTEYQTIYRFKYSFGGWKFYIKPTMKGALIKLGGFGIPYYQTIPLQSLANPPAFAAGTLAPTNINATDFIIEINEADIKIKISSGVTIVSKPIRNFFIKPSNIPFFEISYTGFNMYDPLNLIVSVVERNPNKDVEKLINMTVNENQAHFYNKYIDLNVAYTTNEPNKQKWYLLAKPGYTIRSTISPSITQSVNFSERGMFPECNGNGIFNSQERICDCKGNWDGVRCHTCRAGYAGDDCEYSNQTCEKGTLRLENNVASCVCQTGYTNSPGSIVCNTCKKGFSGTGSLCNEQCGNRGQVNSLGTSCICDPGWALGNDQFKCDKCAFGYSPTGICNVQCNGNGVLNPERTKCVCSTGNIGSTCFYKESPSYNGSFGIYVPVNRPTLSPSGTLNPQIKPNPKIVQIIDDEPDEVKEKLCRAMCTTESDCQAYKYNNGKCELYDSIIVNENKLGSPGCGDINPFHVGPQRFESGPYCLYYNSYGYTSGSTNDDMRTFIINQGDQAKIKNSGTLSLTLYNGTEMFDTRYFIFKDTDNLKKYAFQIGVARNPRINRTKFCAMQTPGICWDWMYHYDEPIDIIYPIIYNSSPSIEFKIPKTWKVDSDAEWTSTAGSGLREPYIASMNYSLRDRDEEQCPIGPKSVVWKVYGELNYNSDYYITKNIPSIKGSTHLMYGYEIKENKIDVIQWGLTSPGDGSFTHINYVIPFSETPQITKLLGCNIQPFSGNIDNSITGFSRDSNFGTGHKCNIYWIATGKKDVNVRYKDGIKL